MTFKEALKNPKLPSKETNLDLNRVFFKDDHDLPYYPSIKKFSCLILCTKKIYRPNFRKFSTKNNSLFIIRPKRTKQLKSIHDIQKSDLQQAHKFEELLDVFFDELEETIPEELRPKGRTKLALLQAFFSFFIFLFLMYAGIVSSQKVVRVVLLACSFLSLLIFFNSIPKFVYSKELEYKSYNKLCKNFVNAFNQRYMLSRKAKIVIPKTGQLFLMIYDPGNANFGSVDDPVYSLSVNKRN